MKKLRAAGQVQAQVTVHGPELLRLLKAGVPIIAPQPQTQATRYDVYYV